MWSSSPGDRESGPQSHEGTRHRQRGPPGKEPRQPGVTSAATAATIATVDPDSRCRQQTQGHLPINVDRQEAALTDPGEVRRLAAGRRSAPGSGIPPVRDPGDPNRGEEERGSGAYRPRGRRAGPRKGRERGRTRLGRSRTLTLLLGSGTARSREGRMLGLFPFVGAFASAPGQLSSNRHLETSRPATIPTSLPIPVGPRSQRFPAQER